MTLPALAWRRQRGSVALQLAILLPAMMAILLGIFYFGLGFYTQNALNYAVREAARYAVVRGSTSTTPATSTDLNNYVKNRVSGLISKQLTVTSSFSPNNSPGSAVTVSATCTLPIMVPFLSTKSLTFTRSAQMTILQ